MYERYCELRDSKGCKDSDVANATGINKSTFSDWKSGRSTPKQPKLQKIADYFGVSLDYLTGKSEKCDMTYYLNEETAKTAQEIYDNDNILFEAYRSSSKDRLVAYAKKLEELRKMEEGE